MRSREVAHPVKHLLENNEGKDQSQDVTPPLFFLTYDPFNRRLLIQISKNY